MAKSTFNWKRIPVILLTVTVLLSALITVSEANKLKRDVVRRMSHEERIRALELLSTKQPVIRMNLKLFNDLVYRTPKNYSVLVTFTTTRRQCDVCQLASYEFSLVANSFWSNPSQSHSSKLFFASVEYDGAESLFQALNLYSAPSFLLFPAGKRNPLTHKKLDILKYGIDAEVIARRLAELTGVQIRIVRPPDYSNWITWIIIAILVGGLLYRMRNNLGFFYNKTAWGVVNLSVVFFCTSGQMWNQINRPPFAQPTREGMTYFRKGRDQLVVETYIVFLLNAAITIGMVLLIEAKQWKGGIWKRRIMFVLGLGMYTIFSGVILSVFSSKSGGYSYGFGAILSLFK